MLNTFRNKHLPAVLSICFLAAVMVLVGGCDGDSEQLPSNKIKGPLKVVYEVQTSPTGTRSTGDKPHEAKEILLFEQYVIIKSKHGSAELLPVDKIKKLSWH